MSGRELLSSTLSCNLAASSFFMRGTAAKRSSDCRTGSPLCVVMFCVAPGETKPPSSLHPCFISSVRNTGLPARTMFCGLTRFPPSSERNAEATCSPPFSSSTILFRIEWLLLAVSPTAEAVERGLSFTEWFCCPSLVQAPSRENRSNKKGVHFILEKPCAIARPEMRWQIE